MQMKKEDEQAGRLDYVYKTNLTIDECINRIGSAVPVKLSEYKTEIDNGILYILWMLMIMRADSLPHLRKNML